MNLASLLTRKPDPVRSYISGPWGSGYAYPILSSSGNKQSIASNFTELVHNVYRQNGVVRACMFVRAMVFSEARFQFRQMKNGRPGNLFGTASLETLERPWPNGTTGDLLALAIQDTDLAGNFFALKTDEGLKRLRPDWVNVVLGSDEYEAEAKVAGYLYHPGGPYSGKNPVSFRVEEIAHFVPPGQHDPEAPYRGESLLGPIIREIAADSAATLHKLKFFENGATPNLIVRHPETVGPELFREWTEIFRQEHEGVANAYKTLAIGGGADVSVVGANLQQLDFKVTQGAGESRIAAMMQVPPVIVGLSEGLQGSSLNQGNYAMARRRFADGTMRPLWRGFAAAMSSIVDVPTNSELWYDDRDIPFLQEDMEDAAKIQQLKAMNIRTLVDGGFDPMTVVDAVEADDMSRLVHTGKTSVQLQPPLTGEEPDAA